MAYDRNVIFEDAKKAIVENNLFFMNDIVAFIAPTKSTFYDYFPVGSEESNHLKELLERNKVKTKSAIRSKLFKSDRASELLALYRLICTSEERKFLNQQYLDHTTGGEQIKIILPDGV